MNRIFIHMLLVLLGLACADSNDHSVTGYRYSVPYYDSLGLMATSDTIRLSVNDTSLDEVGSVQYFTDKNEEYIAVTDGVKLFVNFYQFRSNRIIKKLSLKPYLPDTRPHFTSVYIKNFDSIFVCSKLAKMFLIDSTGLIKQNIDVPQQQNTQLTVFSNSRPPIFRENWLYTGVFPSHTKKYNKALKGFNLIYKFDLNSEETQKCYKMPPRYLQSIYDYHFYNYGYCLNERGNLVFSFPADSNVYETNLTDINIAYNARSLYQEGDIEPERIEDLMGKGGSAIQSRIRDMYGPIFYDRRKRRYLRVFSKRLKAEEYYSGKRERKQTILILNDRLQVIGESSIPDGISFNSLLITAYDEIFALVKRVDKQSLKYVRLNYKNDKLESTAPIGKSEISKF